MALRARIAAPPPPPKQEWPYHTLQWSSVPVANLARGERRMEAENFLSRGSAIRKALEGRATDLLTLSAVASVTQPLRMKGILVSPQFGSPFLAATQAFDVRPTPRKWVALERMAGAEDCFVQDGTILVTRSGTVGRPTIAYAAHRGAVVSDDLLRIRPIDPKNAGWIYAYLQAPQTRAMATGAQYGHVIKHLEASHLAALPIPTVGDSVAAGFQAKFNRILELRNESYADTAAAEERFALLLGPVRPRSGESGFTVKASNLLEDRRRRLDAAYHAPTPAAIRKLFNKWEPLSTVTKRVWWMTRFKRFYGESGIPYMSADELFTVNPTNTKRILVDPDDNHHDYFVERGWIIMACSGQVYGLNGAATLATEYDERAFYSHDLIRIIPDPSRVRAGYLLVALTHPTHGRPLLIRAAYGTSIPHLDPGDVADVPVVRLDPKEEATIADLAEKSAHARATADAIERKIGQEADAIISGSMIPPTMKLVGNPGGDPPEDADAMVDRLARQWVAERPRGADIAEMTSTPAYREIVSMSKRAVRPLLLRLRRKPEHWFAALNEITGANPVPPDSEGKIKQMADAWLRWGKEHGYIGDLD